MGLTNWLMNSLSNSSSPEITQKIVVWGLCFSALSGGILWIWKSPRLLKTILWTQLVWDLLATTSLVVETGGISSGFILVYCLFILLATILLRVEGAIASAVLACGMLLCLGLRAHGWELFAQVSLAMKFLFVISALSFVGATMAFFARNRQRLSESLEKTQHQLEDLSSIYSEIVEHSPSGILVASLKSGRIEFVNPTGVKISGKSWRGELLDSTPWRALVESRERFERQINLPSGQKVIGYHCTELPGGLVLVVFQDLSEVRRLEGQVRLNEKLASVGQLAAGIAHEIRNPLASLSGSIQLMQGELPQDSVHKKLITIVLRETDRLDNLIRNFLNYAKPATLQLENVDVASTLKDVIELIAQKEGVRTRFDIQVSKPMIVKCDPASLRQIFWNLILNAVDAMQGGGRVVIMIDQRDRDAVVSILDEGPGVSPDLRSKIFDPFFTTKKDGTGLGLAMVFQMVRAHGGRLGVEEAPAGGAKFWVELPIKGPEEDEQKVA